MSINSNIIISKKLVIINSISSAVTLILNAFFLVWLQQYLLKQISTEEYSLIPLLMSIMAFAPLLSTILTGGIGRYVTTAYYKGDIEEVTRICSTMFPILLMAGLGLITVGFIAAWKIELLIKIQPAQVDDAKLMLRLLVIITALRLPFSVLAGGFMIKQKLILQDMIDVGCQLLRIAILFSLLYFVSTRVLWVTTAWAIAEFVNMAIAIPLSIKLVPAQRFRLSAFHWPLVKELINYGGWALFGQTAATLKQAMDPLILNRFGSATDVSVFYVAGIAPRQLSMLLGPITRPFFSVLTAMHATGDFVKLSNTYLRTARYHAWLVICISIPAMVFCCELMHLYLGGKYDQAGPVMAVLLMVSILYSFNALGNAIAGAVGPVKEYSLRLVIIQVVNLVLTLFFVAYLHQGAFGSAMATLIAVLLIEASITWRFCRDLAHASTKQWLSEVIQPTLLPAIPALIACLAIKISIGISTWTGLLSASVLSAILYCGCIASFGLRQQDRIDISRLLHRLPNTLKKMIRPLA